MTSSVPRFRGASRTARGTVIGVACLTTTAALHAVAGGAVGALGLAMGALLAVTLGVAVADRRRSVPFLALVILGSQALLHVVLSVGSGHDGMHGSGASVAVMVGAHLIAATATAIALAFADALVHCWLAFLQALRRRRPELGVVLPWSTPCLAGAAPRAWAFQFNSPTDPRGPPLF